MKLILGVLLKWTVLVLLALVLCMEIDPEGMLQAAEPEDLPVPFGFEDYSLMSGGMKRWFMVQTPAAILAKNKMPVVILLHGGTQSMRKLFTRGAGGTKLWPELAQKEGFLLVVPNGVNPDNLDTYGDHQNWNDLRNTGAWAQQKADDVGFLKALLDWLPKHYAVDLKRVYVTGASNGGMMTQRLLIEAPERFAAGAAFISSLPSSQVAISPPKLSTPILLMNGTEDKLVLWNGGQVARNRGETRPVLETVAWWVKTNHVGPTAEKSVWLPDLDPYDECRIHQDTYPAKGKNSAPVVFYTVEGGGHAMPSNRYPIGNAPWVRQIFGHSCRDLDGVQTAWDFMKQFHR
ncbi:MAG: prolyl oligopeptidase family serine peptidase [Cyanobacteria bacterium]|nr:prolyl oligopeptidase family serine peptidase [Cyanobacteriota bacterium]